MHIISKVSLIVKILILMQLVRVPPYLGCWTRGRRNLREAQPLETNQDTVELDERAKRTRYM